MTTPQMTDILTVPKDLDELPAPDPWYFVNTKDQPMVMKKTMFGRALVPVDEIPHLPKIGPVLWARDFPKIPAKLINQVWSYFAEVWRLHKTEAMVYLTWKDGTYRVFVPDQHPTGGHVTVEDFTATKLQRGWRIAGTIHSHCNFGAFHSGTDKADADKHDGVHITMGHVDDPKKFEMACMVSISKIHWDFKAEDIIDGDVGQSTHPKWWEDHIKERRPATTTTTTSGGGWRGSTPTHIYGGSGYHAYPSAEWGDDDELLYYRVGMTGPKDTKDVTPRPVGSPDPYDPKTPLLEISEDSPLKVIDILVARGFWPDADSHVEDAAEWAEDVLEIEAEIAAAIGYLEEYGISLKEFAFGAEPSRLTRIKTTKGHK